MIRQVRDTYIYLERGQQIGRLHHCYGIDTTWLDELCRLSYQAHLDRTFSCP